MLNSNPKIFDAVIAVTYKCNSRCQMCDIWKITEHEDIKPEAYLKLPKIKYLNISGGEAFLREDLPEIVKNIKKSNPQAKLIISTNGFAPELIKKQMTEILKIDPKIGIAISLDGIGNMHAQVRGIPQAYEKVMQTYEMLTNELNMHNIRFGFTLNKDNVKQMSKVYDLTKKLGVQFALSAVHNSEVYFGQTDEQKVDVSEEKQKDLQKEFDYVIADMLKSMSPKNWLRAYFAHGLHYYLTTNQTLLPNYPATNLMFVDPKGDVYPSMIDYDLLGNLGKINDYNEIAKSDNFKTIVAKLRANPQPYWMICTARYSMIKHWFNVLSWILKAKIKLLYK